jgi:HlyD family secretion protein
MSSFLCSLPLIAGLLTACPAESPRLTGYVEGEYVSLAPAQTARIAEILVSRGQKVEKASLLARLEDQDARNLADEAKARLTAAIAQAEGARLELGRVRELTGQNVAAQASFDSAKAALDVAEAQVAQAKANLAQAEWQLSERSLKATVGGKIDDIMRHAGDIAGPNQPIISLLSEQGVKLKLYAPESALTALSPNSELLISCDGCGDDIRAQVSYIAKEPEFTPPVIYSLDRRQKLVYLIEARPIGKNNPLAPGMIVDAILAKP